MLPETCCLRKGVSPKARRKVPRAPLMSRSIVRPSEDLTVLRPPRLCVNGGVKVGRVGGRLLSIGDQILYRLPSFIGL